MKVLLRKCVNWIQQLSPRAAILLAVFWVLAFGVIRYYAPGSASSMLLNMIVVAFLGWRAGRGVSVLFAAILVVTYALSQWLLPGKNLPTPPWMAIWNSITRFVCFAFAGWIMAELARLQQGLVRLVDERTAQWKAEAEKSQATSLQLLEANERFEQVINNIDEAFWLFDIGKDQVVYISPGYERIWGRRANELMKDSTAWLAAVHPLDQERVARDCKPVPPYEGHDVEYRILRPDETVRWVRDRSFPVRNSRGEVHRVSGIVEDITDEKEMRERLQTKAAILENMAEAVVVTDERGIIEDINPAAERMWRMRRDEVLGQSATVLSGLPQAESLKIMAGMLESLNTEGSWRGTFYDRRTDGTAITCEAFVNRLEIHGRRLLVALEQDVTDRLRAEDRLRQSEETLRVFVSSIPEVAMLLDGDGKVLACNQAVASNLRLHPADLMGRCVFDFLPPDIASHRKTMLERATRTGQLVKFEDGRAGRTFVNYASPVVDAAGRVTRVAALAFDITDRKRAETTREAFLALGEKLSAARNRLEAAKAIYATADTLWKWDCGALDLRLAQSDQVETLVAWDLLDGKRREVEPPYVIGLPSTRCRRIMRDGAELILRRPGEPPLEDFVPIGDIRRHSASLMYVPIRREGEAVGVLSIQSYAIDAYSGEDLRTLQALADYCGGALERLRVEEAARQRENVNRAILATAMDGYYALDFWADPNGAITDVNAAFCRMTGFSREELLAMRIVDLEAIESPEEVAHHFQRLNEIGTELFETRHRRKDGREIDVEISLSVLSGVEGGAFGFVRDITERKRTEFALGQKEQLYRTLFDLSPDGILLEDKDGNILEVNQALCQSFGFLQEELVGQNVRTLVPPEFQASVEVHLTTLRDGQRLEHEVWNQRRNGERCLMWLHEKPLPLPDGRVGILVVARDVTQAKRAELIREVFLSLGTRLSAARTQVEAARAVYAAADRLWQWDSATLDLYSPETDVMQAVLNCDVIDGQRREVPSRASGGAPSPRMRRIMSQGAELIADADPALFGVDSIPFGDTSRPSASKMCVPILREGTSVGVLTIQSYTAGAFTPKDLQTLQALTDFCSGALERIRAEEALRESQQLLRAFYDSPGALRGVMELLGTDLRILSANAAQATAQRRDVEAMKGVLASQLYPSPAVLSLWLQQCQEAHAAHRAVTFEYPTDFRAVGSWSQATISPLPLAGANHLRFAYVDIDITAHKRAERMKEAMLSLGTKLGTAASPPDAARAIFATADGFWKWDAATLDLYSPEQDWMQSAILYDVIDGQRREVTPPRPGGKPPARSGRVMREGPELILRQPAEMESTEFLRFGDRARLAASLMYVPLRLEGQPVGVLSIQSYTPNAYTREDLRTLQALADHCTGALVRIRAEAELRQAHAALEQRVQERTAQLQAANAALAANEARLELALDASNAGTWSWVVATNTSDWDQRYHALYGFAPDAAKTFETWIQGVHPEDRERLQAKIQRLLQPGAGDIWNEEFRALHPTKGERWMAGLGRMERDAAGNAVCLTGINLDISERKRLDQALRDAHAKLEQRVRERTAELRIANAALRQSEERYRTLAESSPDAIFIYDSDIRVRYANSTAARWWQRQPEDLVGLHQRDLLPAAAVQSYCSNIHSVFETGKHLRRDEPLTFPSGEQWVEMGLAPLNNSTGKVGAVMGIFRDITERKKAESQLAEALDLNQKMIAASSVGIAVYKASGECVFGGIL